MTKTKTTAEIMDSIINYFDENEEIFNQAIEELDWYNGYLGDDKYYEMDMIDELYHDTEPSEILSRAFYGHDEDWYTTDEHGNRQYSEFNPNRNYFKYNGYGNLISTDYIDYSDYNDEYAVHAMLDNISYIDIIEETPELSELFEQLQKAYDDEEI